MDPNRIFTQWQISPDTTPNKKQTKADKLQPIRECSVDTQKTKITHIYSPLSQRINHFKATRTSFRTTPITNKIPRHCYNMQIFRKLLQLHPQIKSRVTNVSVKG